MSKPIAPFPEPCEVESLFTDSSVQQFSYGGPLYPDTVRIWRDGTELVVTFQYDALTVEQIKRVNGAQWNPDAKEWRIRPHVHNVSALVGFLRETSATFGPKVREALRSAWEGQ